MNWIKNHKKIINTIAGFIALPASAILNQRLGLNINPDVLAAAIVGLFGSFNVGQGIADNGKEAAKLKSENNR